MKKFITAFLFIALALAIQPLAAQTTYGNSTFPLDTLSGTDAMTFTLPLNFDQETVNAMASWQLRLTRLADTATVNVYLEESVDDATSNPDYVIVDTIAASLTIGPALTEQKYLKHYPVRGKKQRIRVTHAGSNATTIVEVDCLLRKKMLLQLVDDDY